MTGGKRESELAKFLRDFDKFTLGRIVGILAVPFVLDFFFSLQPPWPHGSTYITAFVELAAILYSFTLRLEDERKLKRILFLSFIGIIILMLVYFLLYSVFVHRDPATGQSYISGFRCTADALSLANAGYYSGSCPFLSFDALADSGFQPERIWTPWSVRVVSAATFLSWTLFFILASFFFGLVISQRRRRNRRKSPRPPS